MEARGPVFLTEKMRTLAEHSYRLLESLEPDQWHAPTSSSRWNVKDIVAHLLDGNVRRLSSQRDGYFSPRLRPESDSYADLVSFLTGMNDDWTAATYRLSPALLLEFLRFTDAKLLDFLDSLDPFGTAPFPVAWAGEEHSRNWFDIAREYTEKWHHQMQIREAVNRLAPLDEPQFLETAIDVFLRGLPHHYASLEQSPGTRLRVEIAEAETGHWTLLREESGWILCGGGDSAKAEAGIQMSGLTAWKILTKRRPPEEIKKRFGDIVFQGDSRLCEHFLTAVSMMA